MNNLLFEIKKSTVGPTTVFESAFIPKDCVIELNLDLISDDSLSFSENSFEDQAQTSDSVESPVKLDIRKFFVLRKLSKDDHSLFEETPRTSTPLPVTEEEESDGEIDSDPPKPEKAENSDEATDSHPTNPKESDEASDSHPTKPEESDEAIDSNPPKPRKVLDKKRKSSTKPTFSCDLCPKVFVSEICFKKHADKHSTLSSSKLTFTCDLCPKKFLSEICFKRHTRQHNSPSSSKPTFTCDLCQKTFVQELRFKRHVEQHKEGIFNCKFCGKFFSRNDHVVKHENAFHVSRRLHGCDQCGKVFNLKSSLAAHRVQHDASQSDKLQCKSCGKKYVIKKSYRLHLRDNPSHDVLEELKSLK